MYVKTNKNELLILNNFINTLNVNKILNYFFEKKLVNKNTEKYSCMTYILNKEDLSFYWNLIDISKILDILNYNYWKKFIFSWISEYIEMNKWDFLLEHTDWFHDFQAVLYLSNINELDWWEFIIDNSLYNLLVWDIVVFKWKRSHSVNLIKWWNKRISISFWFNKIN